MKINLQKKTWLFQWIFLKSEKCFFFSFSKNSSALDKNQRLRGKGFLFFLPPILWGWESGYHMFKTTEFSESCMGKSETSKKFQNNLSTPQCENSPRHDLNMPFIFLWWRWHCCLQYLLGWSFGRFYGFASSYWKTCKTIKNQLGKRCSQKANLCIYNLQPK